MKIERDSGMPVVDALDQIVAHKKKNGEPITDNERIEASEQYRQSPRIPEPSEIAENTRLNMERGRIEEYDASIIKKQIPNSYDESGEARDTPREAIPNVFERLVDKYNACCNVLDIRLEMLGNVIEKALKLYDSAEKLEPLGLEKDAELARKKEENLASSSDQPVSSQDNTSAEAGSSQPLSSKDNTSAEAGSNTPRFRQDTSDVTSETELMEILDPDC